MKIKLLFVMSFSLFLSEVTTASSITRPFLFQISKGPVKSYIFGTMHTGISLSEFSPIVKNAIEESTTVALEITHAYDRLKILLSDPILFKVKFGVPQGKPLTTVAIDLLTKYWGFPPEFAKFGDGNCELTAYTAPFIFKQLDQEIELIAYEKGKSLVQLDKPGFREAAAIYQSEPCSLTTELREGAQNYKKSLSKWIAMYRLGDSRAYITEAFTPFVDVRNELWMPEILKQLSSGHVFIAVGASHLFGTRGLINRLRLIGFQVNRV